MLVELFANPSGYAPVLKSVGVRASCSDSPNQLQSLADSLFVCLFSCQLERLLLWQLSAAKGDIELLLWRILILRLFALQEVLPGPKMLLDVPAIFGFCWLGLGLLRHLPYSGGLLLYLVDILNLKLQLRLLAHYLHNNRAVFNLKPDPSWLT